MKKITKIPVGQGVRQGDVWIEAIASLPKNLKKAKNNTLSLGSTQGHAHEINGAEVLEAEDGTIYLNVQEEAELKHLLIATGLWTGKHHPVTIPKGVYVFEQQGEYDPYRDAVRNVLD